MKKRKTCGPDEIPMELFMILDDENMQWLTDILNTWWHSGEYPNKLLRAFVASIYKDEIQRSRATIEIFPY